MSKEANNNNVTRTLVDVSTMQATTNGAIIRSINSMLAGVETSAFKIAVKTAYLNGVAIPCGQGTITNRKPLKGQELYSKVNKAKSTISRWIKALNMIIEFSLFDDFNKGVYPFSFDKIIIIFSNDLAGKDKASFDKDTFKNLMEKSVATLEKQAGKGTKQEAGQEAGNEAGQEAGNEAGQEANDDSPIVTFEYNGQAFEVHEATLKAFIEKFCNIA